MVRRICAAALALVMACGSAVGVYADTAVTADSESAVALESYGDDLDDLIKTSGDWQYVVENGKAVLFAYIGNSKKVTVPAKLDGMTVATYGGVGGLENVTSLSFAGTIGIWTSFFDYVNDKLKILDLTNVAKLGSSSFAYCTALKSVTIPKTLESGGQAAFAHCTGLKSVTINGNGVGNSNSMFADCTSLKSVKINKSVKSIGPSTFYGCTSLKSVTIPKTVKEIGDYAFGYKENEKTGEAEKIKGFTIKGYSGSAAIKYAKENKINFLLINKTPTTPVIKKSTATNSTVKLSFKHIAGISGYKVQQYDSSKKKWVTVGLSKVDYGEGTGYSYTITGLKSGKKYKFRVQAYTKVNSKKTLKSGVSKTYTVKTK